MKSNDKKQTTNASPQSQEIRPPVKKRSSKLNLEIKFNKKNMLVAVRSRPLNLRELEFSNISTVKISNREIVSVMNPLEYNYSNEGHMYLNDEKQMSITKSKEHQFKFDFAFGEVATQEEVYHYTTEMLLNDIVEGFNATVFAYGATGSGKTYTMVGNGEQPGLMIRSIGDLFARVDKEKGKNFNIQISYVEVYNETLRDLLSEDKTSDNVDIRNDRNKGVVLVGAKLKSVTNANDAFKLLIKGNKRRREQPTVFNENSSRSHAILQVHLEIKEQIQGMQSQITFGKFILVDLAGSEKVTSYSKQSNESGSINKSLLALANCINSLVTQNKGFIPWRDSKLTRILQDSLGGNSRIVMVATISPSLMCIEETLHTLQYANRAKNLKINLTKKIIEENLHIPKYDEVIKSLQTEINLLKMEISEKEKVYPISGGNVNINGAFELQSQFENYQNEFVNHFQKEVKLRKEIIEKEREIETIKNDINENELQIGNSESKPQNVQLIKQVINTKKDEVEKKKIDIANLYIQEVNLKSERKALQNIISRLNKSSGGANGNQSVNIIVKNLLSIYRFYIALLENLSSEHRKFINLNEIMRKDKIIEYLSKQLDLRDKVIITVGEKIRNAKGNFTYHNTKFQSADEIDLIPYKLPVIKLMPDYENSKANSPIKTPNTSNNNRQINNNKHVRFAYSNTVPAVQKSLSVPRIITTNRQYNHEINSILLRNSNSFLGKIQGLTNFRRNLVNIGSQYLNKGFAGRNVGNKNLRGVFRRGGMGNNFRYNSANSQNKYQGNRSNSNERSNTTNSSINKSTENSNFLESNTSRLENEIQKKVKTILAKDFIGRYRRSPYI